MSSSSQTDRADDNAGCLIILNVKCLKEYVNDKETFLETFQKNMEKDIERNVLHYGHLLTHCNCIKVKTYLFSRTIQ